MTNDHSFLYVRILSIWTWVEIVKNGSEKLDLTGHTVNQNYHETLFYCKFNESFSEKKQRPNLVHKWVSKNWFIFKTLFSLHLYSH